METRIPARRAFHWAGLTALATLIYGCGGGGSAASSPEAEAARRGPAFPGVAEFLNLDLATLQPYAGQPFPVHYDADVFRTQDNQPQDNPITDRGATLGRVLFHDKRLSTTNSVSCASCHRQPLGLGDAAAFSQGVLPGSVTGAHAMRLENTRFYGPGSMFWDKRAPTLEFQTTQPIQSAVEMGFDAAHGGISALIAKMRALPYYPELFQFTFGDANITEARIQRALAQFVRSMASTHSRWDEGAARAYNPAAPNKGLGVPFPNFTPSENRGQQLFFAPRQQGGAGCAGCHVPPTFSLIGNSRSNGLEAGETRIFKAPSLKGVSATGPYMHDASYKTLEEVVDHYNDDVEDGPALDNRLRGPDGKPQRLNLSAADKTALVDFLKTLRDTTLEGDPRFSDPFKK